MARSLDELIEFVLGEIALRGDLGATVTDILGFIDSFYAPAPPITDQKSRRNASERRRTVTVDRPFQEQVWKWLLRHQDVSINEKRGADRLSLAEALERGNEDSVKVDLDPKQGVMAIHGKDVKGRDAPSSGSRKAIFRVHVCTDRMWLALCGHPPDSSLVLPLEFKLLSIIASVGKNGILQGDLVKSSGQDKRSVPNRTNVLQTKGYIEKRRVQVRGTNTSLLLLRRFAEDPEARAAHGEGLQTLTDETPFVDIGALLQQTFEHLRNDKIISHKTLRDRVGMGKTLWFSKKFSRLIRRLEETGCVRRVRARSKHSASLHWYYPSVKYIRDPSEMEFKYYVTTRSNIGTPNDQASGSFNQDEDDEEIAGDDTVIASEEPDPKEPLIEVGGPIAQWNPDRQFIHTLIEIIERSGEGGISIEDIRQAATGHYFQRSIENMLYKFVADFAISQPPLLRHLSIVRDVHIVWKTTKYIHYTYGYFKSLVDKGQTAWEAVISNPKGVKAISSSANEEKRDAFGFLQIDHPAHQYKGGRASLAKLVEASKPEQRRPGKADPVIMKKGNQQVIGYGPTPPASRKAARQSLASSAPQTAEPDIEVSRQLHSSRQVSPMMNENLTQPRQRKKGGGPLGRPRKFLRGTEKFWQEQFGKIRVKKSTGKQLKEFGKMSDPAGLALFASRPPNFDEALVRAIESDLPIPLEPEDICQEWVDLTNAVLNNDRGVFVSPKCPVSRSEAYSQILVIKSSRLKDFHRTQTGHTSAIRVITSSVSHTSSPTLSPMTMPYQSKDSYASRNVTLPADGKARRGRPKKRKASSDAPLTRTESNPTRVLEDTVRAVEPVANVVEAPSTPLSTNWPSSLGTEQLEHGLTTRSGRELPKRSVHPSSSTRNSRKRKRATTDAPSPEERSAEADRHQTLVDNSARNTPASTQIEPSGVDSSRALDVSRAQGTEVATQEENGVIPPNTLRHPAVNPIISPEPSALRGQDQVQSTDPEPCPPQEVENSLNGLEPKEIMLDDRQPKYETNARLRIKTNGSLGGTVALTRRNIVMDLIKHCHGAIPMGPPLQYGFITQWRKLGYHGLPDNRTIDSAVKALLASGKVRRLVFGQRTVGGVAKYKYSMLVRPEMLSQPANTDDFVKDLRKKMEEKDPEAYFPEDLDFDEALRKEKHPQILGRKQGIADIDRDAVTISDTIPSAIKGQTLRLQRSEARKRQREQRRAESSLRKTSRRSKKEASKQAEVMTDLPSPKLTLNQQPLRLFPKAQQPRAPLQLSDQTRKTLRTIHPARPGVFGQLGPQAARLPTSLDEILRGSKRGRPPNHDKKADPDFSRYCREVGHVERWEIRRSDLFNTRSNDWHFINHHAGNSFIQSDASPSQFRFEGLTRFDNKGKEYCDQNSFRDDRSTRFPARSQILPNEGNYSLLFSREPQWRERISMSPTLDSAASSTLQVTDSSRHSSAAPPPLRRPTGRKRKRVTESSKSRKKLRIDNKITSQPELDQSLPMPKTTRGPQLLKKLSRSQILEIAVAVVVVRALTGGIERSIDWSLVMRCLPDADEKLTQGRWRTMANKYRREIDALGDTFNSKYLRAYERDEVPPLDFNDLESHDWQALMRWATVELQRNETQTLPELPPSRKEMERTQDIVLDEYNPAMRSIYDYYNNYSVPMKEQAMANIPFGIPYSPPAPKIDSEQIRLAKSWHRAIVLAGDNLDSRMSAAKFSLIPQTVHQSALQSLYTAKTLRKPQKLKNSKKANFSNVFDSIIGKKRMIESNVLKRAARFKIDVMDKKFAAGKPVTYEAGLTVDGDMLVIVNLAAQGRVKIVAVNEPCDRYGLVHSYQTRTIPREKFFFQVDVLPVEGSYIHGFPISKPPPIPRVDINANGIIPLWVDIHGRVDLDMWQRVVAACVGLISTRTGMSTEELTEMLRPALELEDTQWVVQWLSEGGFVRRTEGGGWEAEEWWWAVFMEEKGDDGAQAGVEDGT